MATVDARPIVASGGEPFETILAAVRSPSRVSCQRPGCVGPALEPDHDER